jgi:hypothetical protein
MYCVYEEIKSACKKSCGVIDSCQDDSDFTFSLRNGNTQNCFGSIKMKKRLQHEKTDTAMKMIGRLQQFLLNRVLDHAGFVPTPRITLTSM